MKLVLLLYALASMVDYWTTIFGLRFVSIYESNPVMAMVISRYGYVGMLVWKISGILAIWLCMTCAYKIMRSFEPKYAWIVFAITYFGITVPQWHVSLRNIKIIMEVL